MLKAETFNNNNNNNSNNNKCQNKTCIIWLVSNISELSNNNNSNNNSSNKEEEVQANIVLIVLLNSNYKIKTQILKICHKKILNNQILIPIYLEFHKIVIIKDNKINKGKILIFFFFKKIKKIPKFNTKNCSVIIIDQLIVIINAIITIIKIKRIKLIIITITIIIVIK